MRRVPPRLSVTVTVLLVEPSCVRMKPAPPLRRSAPRDRTPRLRGVSRPAGPVVSRPVPAPSARSRSARDRVEDPSPQLLALRPVQVFQELIGVVEQVRDAQDRELRLEVSVQRGRQQEHVYCAGTQLLDRGRWIGTVQRPVRVNLDLDLPFAFFAYDLRKLFGSQRVADGVGLETVPLIPCARARMTIRYLI